jgi:leucyl/phenylalanyl-tRNA---protein transferase
MPVLAPLPRPVGPSRWTLPDACDESGLVGVGADLEPETLVDANRRGIFPSPHPGTPLPWFSPNPRAVIRLDHVRVSRSLRQRLRRSGWETTADAAFPDVVAGCVVQHRTEGTWITPQMADAYTRLHELGWAHSVEVWDGDALVGGCYGVLVGACFTGESMFHRAPDASKVAVVDLAARLAAVGGACLDVQLPTDHLGSLGAVAVPRERFLAQLRVWRDQPVRLPLDRLPVARLA